MRETILALPDAPITLEVVLAQFVMIASTSAAAEIKDASSVASATTHSIPAALKISFSISKSGQA